ncbi:MAG: hypothetical protein GY711_27225 [bacterium]|nr:hypothetical protein [bacterium]
MENFDDEAMGTVRAGLGSQYRATLAMLRDAIERCPENEWTNTAHENAFWRIVYHTLFYTHLYAMPDESSFHPWAQHQTDIQHMDDRPAPKEIEDLLELPHRPPQTGTRHTLLFLAVSA